MKVLIITETLFEGGAELFALRLARGLIHAGEEVQVVSLNKRYENKGMTALFLDVPIKRLSLPFFPVIEIFDKVLLKLGIDFSLRYFLQGKQLKRISKGFDIIHSHYIQVDYLIASIRKDITCRHFVTVHGDYSAQYDSFQKGQLHLWLNLDKKLQKLNRLVEQWVVLSEEQRCFFLEKMNTPAEKIQKIYNGYAAPAEADVQDKETGKFTVGMVARGAEQKGWQLLINVFLKLPENCYLLLVGGSEYLEELKYKYTNETRIKFTGYQADPAIWMKQMDVFVLPTYYPFESLPYVITEAMYCGLPVVATDVGEIKQMLTDDTTGCMAGFVISFIDRQPDEKELYEKILHLYNHPDERKKMESFAKAAAKKFDMKICIDLYRRIYQQLIS